MKKIGFKKQWRAAVSGFGPGGLGSNRSVGAYLIPTAN
jgi:hypothetical protein